MKKLSTIILFAVISLAYTACNDSTEPINNGPEKGEVTARVDGSAWENTLNLSTTAIKTEQSLTIAAIRVPNPVNPTDVETITLTIVNPKLGSNPNAVGMFSIKTGNDITNWVSLPFDLNITMLTATEAKGTFAFTGTNPSTFTSKSITNGNFYVGLTNQ